MVNNINSDVIATPINVRILSNFSDDFNITRATPMEMGRPKSFPEIEDRVFDILLDTDM